MARVSVDGESPGKERKEDIWESKPSDHLERLPTGSRTWSLLGSLTGMMPGRFRNLRTKYITRIESQEKTKVEIQLIDTEQNLRNKAKSYYLS